MEDREPVTFWIYIKFSELNKACQPLQSQWNELIQNYPRNYYLQSMSGPMNGTRRSSVAWDPNSWKEECLNLTQDLLDAEDSVPFRQPVDPIEVPVSYSSKCCSLLFSHGLMLIPDIETFFSEM